MRILLAASLIIAAAIVCAVGWTWDLRRTKRNDGLARTLTELQARRKDR